MKKYNQTINHGIKKLKKTVIKRLIMELNK